MNDVVCENINNGFCTKNVHDAMMRMGGNESFLYIGGLFDPVFVCYWNEIPNLRHVERLKNYLIEKFCIKWVSQATVKKFGNDIINISHNGNFLTLSRKKDGVIKININFEEDFDTFIWKNTGQNQNISLYHKKYPYFEGDDCIRYLHQYLPFHLPQIEHVLKSVLQSDIFIDKSTINILDIGSGPATVPLALLKLRTLGLNDKRFRITTIEPSDRFGKMISTFKKVKTEGIEIVDNLKYNFPDIDLKIDTNFQIDWIIIANSMSPIGDKKSSKDVNLIFNKFITERLHNGNSNYKILLTIIEGNDDEFFDIIEYLEQIEKIGFSDLRIIESKMTFTKMPKHEDKILLCKFYKTHTKFCTPYINSKSLLLELKKK